MSFIENIPEERLKDFAINQFEKNKRLQDKNSELQSKTSKLQKRLGIQPDGFIDTPSLNIIFFDENTGRPYCEEHGIMNCYKHDIYRCVMCGVVVSLKNRRVTPIDETK